MADILQLFLPAVNLATRPAHNAIVDVTGEQCPCLLLSAWSTYIDQSRVVHSYGASSVPFVCICSLHGGYAGGARARGIDYFPCVYSNEIPLNHSLWYMIRV